MPRFGRNPGGARVERVKQSPFYKDECHYSHEQWHSSLNNLNNYDYDNFFTYCCYAINATGDAYQQ